MKSFREQGYLVGETTSSMSDLDLSMSWNDFDTYLLTTYDNI